MKTLAPGVEELSPPIAPDADAIGREIFGGPGKNPPLQMMVVEPFEPDELSRAVMSGTQRLR